MKYILDVLGQMVIAMILLKLIIYLIPKPIVSIFEFSFTVIKQFINVIFKDNKTKNTKRKTSKTSNVINLRTKKKAYNK